MRILWLCNIMPPIVAEKLQMESSVKEGWITGILSRLIAEGRDNEISLGIAFPAEENLKSFHDVYVCNGLSVDCFGFYEDLCKPELYQVGIERRLEEITQQFKPDVIHVFGTEYPHALAMARVYPHPERLLVGIQGVISLCAEEYLAEIPNSISNKKTFRDLLKKDSILQQQEKFKKRGELEKKTLRIAGNVTGRTAFDKEFCKKVNEDAVYYPMNETMRPCFYEGSWQLEKCKRHRIFFSQADYPLKGFHYLLQAMPQILSKYPDAEIVVAGNDIIHKQGLLGWLKISSYGKYLQSLIKKYHLQEKVHFAGKLSAEQMKQQYLECHTFVCASSLENSPNSVAEAMLLGTPVVASRVGGVPSMITDQKEGLLFENGDTDGLADAVLELWREDSILPIIQRISKAAALRARQVHDPETNFKRLKEIYREIEAYEDNNDQ